MTVLCLWLWLRGGIERLVVARLWVFFFFFWLFAVVGGCRLRSGGRGRLLGARLCARARVCVCFFPSTVVFGCGLWGNDSSGYCYCVVMVFVMVVYYYFDELFILF